MFCKACGYELTGIASGPCPECAREFDAADPASFDAVPRRTKLRRRLRRLTIGFAVLALAVVFFPRGYARARLILRPAGGPPVELVRLELAPPVWLAKIGVAYPGRTREVAPTGGFGLVVDFYASSWRFTMRGKRSAGSLRSSAGTGADVVTINGVTASPENARAVFNTVIPDMFADRGFGVTIGSPP